MKDLKSRTQWFIFVFLVTTEVFAQIDSPYVMPKVADPYAQELKINPNVQPQVIIQRLPQNQLSNPAASVTASDIEKNGPQTFLGNRSELQRYCPRPSQWIPKNDSPGLASEWHIVPTYVRSISYPNRQMGLKVTFSNDELFNCDYVKVFFKGDQIDYTDFSECKTLNLGAESFESCMRLLELKKK